MPVQNRQILDTEDPFFGTKAMLESKRPPIGEIEVTLFEHCNIVCDFCFHDKKSTVGMSRSEIMSKLELIEQFFIARQGTVSIIQLNMVGGELFQDELLDEYIPLYMEFALAARELSYKYGFEEFRIVWVSNFLFKRSELICWMQNDLKDRGMNTSLICSYDVTGRPVNKVYAKNITKLREHISTINMVATVPTMLGLMQGEDKYFDWLYDNFEIYLDDYIPDPGYSNMMPSDWQLYGFYRYMLEVYPNVIPVREFANDDPKPMHCLSLNKLTIFPNNSTANCLWNRYSAADFVSDFNRDDNAGKMQTHMDTYGCAGCEYFEVCGLRCFVQSDWRERQRDLPDCVMRQTFHFARGKECLDISYNDVIESLKDRQVEVFRKKQQLIPVTNL